MVHTKCHQRKLIRLLGETVENIAKEALLVSPWSGFHIFTIHRVVWWRQSGYGAGIEARLFWWSVSLGRPSQLAPLATSLYIWPPDSIGHSLCSRLYQLPLDHLSIPPFAMLCITLFYQPGLQYTHTPHTLHLPLITYRRTYLYSAILTCPPPCQCRFLTHL